jgi:mannose-6-phosphate isomerase-like protein (cupin superfamily)
MTSHLTGDGGTAAAKDLREVEPAALGVELDGYAHLPRMLDKARATLAGSAGRYMFGCPVDHTCMARLGVSPELVLELAGSNADNATVLAKLREHGIPAAEDAWFDAQAVEDELDEAGYLRVRRAGALPDGEPGRVFAGAEHGSDVDVVVVDVEPGEQRGPRTPRRAEVWVIQAGEATFYLGARQARVVRPGDMVRVPAGMEHRLENSGQAVFSAVLARPAAS